MIKPPGVVTGAHHVSRHRLALLDRIIVALVPHFGWAVGRRLVLDSLYIDFSFGCLPTPLRLMLGFHLFGPIRCSAPCLAAGSA